MPPNLADEHDERFETPLMISVSGVRGIVGGALTPEIACRFAQAYGCYLSQTLQRSNVPTFRHPKVLLARDTRRSGVMLRHAVLAGLLGTGCHVIDLGICATPTLQLSVPFHRADGAICITASHNPIQWNALKFFRPNGMYLSAELGQQLLEVYHRGKFGCCGWDGLGSLDADGEATRRHVERILSSVDADAIRSKHFRVVIDCCNGAGAVITPYLLRRLGCEVIELNCDIHSNFPHDPEPIAANLAELCAAVRRHGADVGFAHDADVDRVSIVTEQGEALGEEYSLIFAVHFVLSRRKGAVVTNLSTSMAIDDVARQHGCTVYRTPVGEVNVAEKMRDIGAVIGGEGNGGIINPDIHLTRDGPAGLALILNLLAESNQKVSKLAAGLPRYVIVKKQFRFPREKAPELLNALRRAIPADSVDERDGLKFLWSDRWVHVRPSGTEPIVRVIAEAKDMATAEQLCATAEAHLRRCTPEQ
ncbi:MAG: phosphoglucosamine mutase [Abditibacteriales bacterium]|nr:phosphoglucosamine mutase [Abditibacteriales bacterium]MDW8367121.1 phosphoglucosamine mutase [Abditibacteriales bacterium]